MRTILLAMLFLSSVSAMGAKNAMAAGSTGDVTRAIVYHVRVDARPAHGYWTETRVDIKDGSRYIVTVADDAGEWVTNPWWKGRLGVGSTQYSKAGAAYLLPGAPEGALIGKVGNDGRPFLIGNGALTPAGASGKLFLTTNDEPKGFADNSGVLWVNVYSY
jgi:hypothetical protein